MLYKQKNKAKMARDFNFIHQIDATSHFNRAIICLEKAFTLKESSYLFYAALELRISIERLLVEYLVLVGANEEKIESMMNTYRVKDLSRAIYETEPEFDKKLEFTNFYIKTIGADFEIPIPDKNQLNYYYGKLGGYLHNFKKPVDSTQNQEWWNTLIQFLEESRAYLSEHYKVPHGFFKMNEKGLELYTSYKDELIPREGIKQRILEGK